MNEGNMMDELTREATPDVDVDATSIAYSDLIDVRVPDSPAMLFPGTIDLGPEAVKTTSEPGTSVAHADLVEHADTDVDADVEAGTDVDVTTDVDMMIGTVAAPDVKVDDDVIGVKVNQITAPTVTAPVRPDYVAGTITGLKYGIGGTAAATVGYGVYRMVDGIASFMTSTSSLLAGAFVTAASAATFIGIKYREHRQTRALTSESAVINVGQVKLGDAVAQRRAQLRPSSRSAEAPITTGGTQPGVGTVAVQRSVGASATSPVMLAPVSAAADDVTYHRVGQQVSAINVGATRARSVVQPGAVQRADAPPLWLSKKMQARSPKPGRLSEWMNGEPIVIGSQSESKATDVKAASLAYWGNDVIEDDSLLFDSLTRMWIMLMRDPNTEQVVGSWIGKEKFKPCEVFGSSNKLDKGARCAVGHLLQIVDPDGWNPDPNSTAPHNDFPAVCHKYGGNLIWEVIKRNDSGRWTLPEIADYVRDELAKRV